MNFKQKPAAIYLPFFDPRLSSHHKMSARFVASVGTEAISPSKQMLFPCSCRIAAPSELTLQSQLFVLTLMPCQFHPVLTQWHVKDPEHFAKAACGRLHLNTRTPLTQWSWSGLTMPLSRHSVETYPETSSHTTCQGMFVSARWATVNWSWHKKRNLHARTNLHFKKKSTPGMNDWTLPQTPGKRG